MNQPREQQAPGRQQNTPPLQDDESPMGNPGDEEEE